MVTLAAVLSLHHTPHIRFWVLVGTKAKAHQRPLYMHADAAYCTMRMHVQYCELSEAYGGDG